MVLLEKLNSSRIACDPVRARPAPVMPEACFQHDGGRETPTLGTGREPVLDVKTQEQQ